MTVRELVKAVQAEMLAGDMAPARQRELLIKLTSLYGNCLMEVTRTKGAYTAVRARCLDEEKKANRANIRAELSPEYAAWQEADNVEALTLQMIRSLSKVLSSTQEEMRMAGRS